MATFPFAGLPRELAISETAKTPLTWQKTTKSGEGAGWRLDIFVWREGRAVKEQSLDGSAPNIFTFGQGQPSSPPRETLCRCFPTSPRRARPARHKTSKAKPGAKASQEPWICQQSGQGSAPRSMANAWNSNAISHKTGLRHRAVSPNSRISRSRISQLNFFSLPSPPPSLSSHLSHPTQFFLGSHVSVCVYVCEPYTCNFPKRTNHVVACN